MPGFFVFMFSMPEVQDNAATVFLQSSQEWNLKA
jgi:hypothetical protein